jgi:hypothetical protein
MHATAVLQYISRAAPYGGMVEAVGDCLLSDVAAGAFWGDRPSPITVLCPGDFLGSPASLIRVTGHLGDGF